MADPKKPTTSTTPVSNDSMRVIVHEAIEPFAKRLDELEVDVRGLRSDVTKWRAEEAESLARVATASARAVDIALKAQTDASGAKGEMTNIVASALRIHGQSIAQTVDGAVKAAVEPLVKDVDALRQSTGERLTKQDKSLAAQDTELASIRTGIDGLFVKLTEFHGRPWMKWVVVLVAFAGSAVGAYLAHAH